MKFDNLIIMLLFLVVVFVSGILGGVVLFEMNLLETELYNIDFDLPLAQNSSAGVANVTTFQELMDITIYPLFTITDTIPYLVYFMIFGFIAALGITAYMSSKNPIFFVLHVLFTLILTYFAMILSNTYLTLLEDAFINTMMVEFGVYNMVMTYLPQIFFMVSLVFAGVSFVNVLKPSTKENPYGLNYGGDY